LNEAWDKSQLLVDVFINSPASQMSATADPRPYWRRKRKESYTEDGPIPCLAIAFIAFLFFQLALFAIFEWSFDGRDHHTRMAWAWGGVAFFILFTIGILWLCSLFYPTHDVRHREYAFWPIIIVVEIAIVVTMAAAVDNDKRSNMIGFSAVFAVFLVLLCVFEICLVETWSDDYEEERGIVSV
jgi:hypothetical protein